MAYLLGYGTAVEWLRMNRDVSLLLTRYELPFLSLEASRRRLQRHVQQTEHLTKPLHLVVSLRDSRRPSAEAVCHLLKTPDGTYPAVRLDRGIFASGPELAFLQMANVLDEETLRFLGMELCGRYGIGLDGKVFRRLQTAKPEELLLTAQTMAGARGHRRAATVATRVWGGAGSPMEAALALILCSDPELGGFGLPAPELNKPLPVTGDTRDDWGDDFITPDLLWEAGKVAIEYDSELHHTASHRISVDASRRDVLVDLGYRVITVTTEHMRKPKELARIAGIVARQLGIELVPCDDEEWTRRVQYQLRMRRLAEHPEVLLGFSKEKRTAHQSWHVRGPHPVPFS